MFTYCGLSYPLSAEGKISIGISDDQQKLQTQFDNCSWTNRIQGLSLPPLDHKPTIGVTIAVTIFRTTTAAAVDGGRLESGGGAVVWSIRPLFVGQFRRTIKLVRSKKYVDLRWRPMASGVQPSVNVG